MPTYANCTLPGLESAWTTHGVRNARTTLKYNGSDLVLAKGEYPTGLSFNSASGPVTKLSHFDPLAPGGTYKASLVICDSLGRFPHKFSDAQQDYDRTYDYFTTQVSGQSWTDLNNKTLAIGKIHVSTPNDYVTNLLYIDRYDATYPEMTVTITTAFVPHTISWTNPSLSFSQEEYVLTVTKGGSADDSWGGTITYKLYMDGVDQGAFSEATKAITLTDDQLEVPHTFELYAVSTARGETITSVGCSASHTPHSVHKTMKYWNGTAWIECYANVRVGSTWVEVEPFYYDGTTWVPCSQT